MTQRQRLFPTTRLRRLALELRQLRDRSGLSREEVARRTEINRATLYRIENAQTKPQVRTLRALLNVYQVPELRQAELVSVLKSAEEENWLQADLDLPGHYATYIGFEHEASGVLNYEPMFIPGLLQTEAYARTAIPGGAPGMLPVEIENRVTARMARQRRCDPSFVTDFVIDEDR